MATTLHPLVDYCHALVARRRARPGDDLLSCLIHTCDDRGDRLGDRELVTMVLSLVIAGHDTTASFIANSVWALLTHPDQLAILRDDPSVMPEAVQELLRWCTPVLVSRIRYATEDVDLGGARFAAGDAVMAVLCSANHDPREFPDADRLDLRRRPRQRSRPHVSFGAGLHHCLGAVLAQHEAEIALTRLLGRYPHLGLATSSAALTWLPLSGMRKLERLPLAL
jgi:cytochrome P450